MYPGTIAGLLLLLLAARLPLEKAGFGHTTSHPVIMQTRYLQRGDLFERRASKKAALRRRVLALLGLDGIAACASGSCGGKHGFLGLARVC